MNQDPENIFSDALKAKIQTKSVPPAMLRNYEAEVYERLAHPRFARSGWGVTASVICLLLLAGLGVFLIMSARQAREVSDQKKLSVVSVPEAVEEKVKTVEESDPGTADAEFKNVSQNLWVLEMLGESDGLIDDSALMDSDAVLLSQMGSMEPGVMV